LIKDEPLQVFDGGIIMMSVTEDGPNSIIILARARIKPEADALPKYAGIDYE
jgi:hypothetical protein